MTLASVLASPRVLAELAFLSVLSLAPVLGRQHLKRFLSRSEPQLETASETSTVIELEHLELDSEDETTAPETPEEVDESAPRVRPASVDIRDMDLELELESAMDEKRGRCGRRERSGHRQRWGWNRLSMSIPRWAALHAQESEQPVR